jgi:hypothetical protein
MSLSKVMEIYQFFWTFESHHHQRLAWDDAAEARVARARAEALAQAQLDAMLTANPSGSLGHGKLDDEDSLEGSGLL